MREYLFTRRFNIFDMCTLSIATCLIVFSSFWFMILFIPISMISHYFESKIK
jgi:hypothetical protein